MSKYGKGLNRVLFLDIDGVLNGYKISKREAPYPLSEFNEDKVSILNSLIEHDNELKIVLSSSWRFMPGIENVLREVGIKKEIFSVTPYSPKNRGDEVYEWICAFGLPLKYCIIDDVDDFNHDQKSNLVLTNPYLGITREDINKIKKILYG